MRLTLRYLLAYMDESLEPEEMREIGRKIEENEFASDLLHRIRDVTRRAKLDAPHVVGRKEALDPNTVADYLDNTLPADRVADFEKVCLDSDIQLAEVACCHQILSLVLGEPAEVNPESRVRMYHLPETAQSQPAEEEPAPVSPAAVEPPLEKPADRARPSVPDYLREARQRRKRAYFLAVSSLLLAVLAYLASTDKLGLFRAKTEPSDQVAMTLPLETAPPSTPVPADSIRPGEAAPAAAPERPLPPVAPPAAPPAGTGSAAAATKPPKISEPAALPAIPAPPPAPRPIVPVKPTPVEPTAVEPESTPAPRVPAGAPPAPPVPGVAPETKLPATPPAPVAEPVPVAGPMAPETKAGPREVGRLVRAEEIALVYEPQTNTFSRIANSRQLRPQDRIVSLPTSRPVFAFDGKLNIEMVDGGEMVFLPSGDGATPDLELTSGRTVISATPQAAPLAVTIRAGGTEGALWLPEPSAQVAIEVARAPGPIVDPEARPAPAITRLWGVSGEFTWQPLGAASATTFQAPVVVDLTAGASVAGSEVPAWIGADLTSALDRRASDNLRQAVGFDRNADLALRELTDHRQKETRQLALRWLSWIEDFEPAVAMLNNAERYAEWTDVIDLLRDAVRRGPRTAKSVHSAMEALYGANGTAMYELLWKFDTKELNRTQAIELVQYLAHETLAMRVLSFRNLNQITGLGFFYRPEQTELKRRQALQRWDDWSKRRPAEETETEADPVPAPFGP